MPGIREGFRERLLAFQRITTGIKTDISVTGNIITRGSGSFVTDGFLVGEEVTHTGFNTGANNGTSMITAVTALQLTTDKTFTTEAAGAPVTVEIKVPSLKKWENRILDPINGRPVIEEKLNTPQPQARTGIGPKARVKLEGSYDLRLVYPPNMGTLPIEAMINGLLLWFHSGVPPLPLDNGYFLHLRSSSKLGAITEEKTKCSAVVSIAFSTYLLNPA